MSDLSTAPQGSRPAGPLDRSPAPVAPAADPGSRAQEGVRKDVRLSTGYGARPQGLRAARRDWRVDSLSFAGG